MVRREAGTFCFEASLALSAALFFVALGAIGGTASINYLRALCNGARSRPLSMDALGSSNICVTAIAYHCPQTVPDQVGYR